MSFKNRLGDQKLIERLSQSIISDKVSHAYIFEGDANSNLDDFALSFVKAILCKNEKGIGCDSCITCNKINHGNYEDLYIVSPLDNSEKTVRSIRDKQIEELQIKLKNRPNNERNIAIIKECDTITLRGQNRLLKTLEEPSNGTIIILLCSNLENLIDTIKSRAVKYHIYGNYDDISDLTFANDLVLKILNHETFYTISENLNKNVKNREEALDLLDSMEKVLRNMLIDNTSVKKRDRIIKLVNLVEEARKDIVYKVKYINALKNIVLKI